jgi:hypothetical protein
MTVVLMTINMLIMEMAILEIDLFDQAAFNEEGNGSVNRGLRDPLLLVSQTDKKAISIEMVMSRKDLFDDQFSLRRVPKALFSDVFPKFLNFIHNDVIIIETHFQ